MLDLGGLSRERQLCACPSLQFFLGFQLSAAVWGWLWRLEVPTYLWCDQVKPLLYTAFLAMFAFRQPRPLRPVQHWSRKTFPSREEAQAARHELNCTFHLFSSHSCYPSWALNPAACVWHCTWSCHSLHSPSLRIFIASGAISKIYYTSVALESWLVSQVMVLPLHLYFVF